jgi:hypothetical protein
LLLDCGVDQQVHGFKALAHGQLATGLNRLNEPVKCVLQFFLEQFLSPVRSGGATCSLQRSIDR